MVVEDVVTWEEPEDVVVVDNVVEVVVEDNLVVDDEDVVKRIVDELVDEVVKNRVLDDVKGIVVNVGSGKVDGVDDPEMIVTVLSSELLYNVGLA